MATFHRSSNYAVGDVIPFHLSPAIIVASFFVSLVGSVTAFELAQRRMPCKGWTKWLQLGSCACSMGLVAIWCMDYVGNRAIIMGNGEADVQLFYHPGYTALSSILPILTLFITFAIADRKQQRNRQLLVLCLSGILAGTVLAGTHYLGAIAVANYSIEFKPPYVAGVVMIACVCGVGGLILIFMFQEIWMHILAVRIFCAFVFAGAVCSAHFEASIGTEYRLKHLSGVATSKEASLIIAIVLSLATIPVCVGIAVSASRRRSAQAERGHRIVLACARFSSDGRLMVTQKGLLPCKKIDMARNQTPANDEFDNTHSAFQWIFRVSHDWISVIRFLPSMRRHLSASRIAEESAEHKFNSTRQNIGLRSKVEENSVLFRESFCVAAADLARDLGENMIDLGTLYHEVLTTGTAVFDKSLEHKSFLQRTCQVLQCIKNDVEVNSNIEQFGTGQLLLLVKTCGKNDISRLEEAGYRFVSVEKTVEHLAKSMRVAGPYLASHLQALKEQLMEPDVTIPVGTYIGCFALRAGVARPGWEVLALKERPDRLPCIQIAPGDLDGMTKSVLENLNGCTVEACIKHLDRTAKSKDEAKSRLGARLNHYIARLASVVAEPFFQEAILSSTMLRVPTYNPATRHSSEYNLFPFHVIPDVHRASLKWSTVLIYTPLSFFRCRQKTTYAGAHISSFERKVHHEFSLLYSQNEDSQDTAPENVSISSEYSLPRRSKSFFETRAARSSKSLRQNTGGGSSSNEWDHVAVKKPVRYMTFGGILVSQDVRVKTVEEGDRSRFVSEGTIGIAEEADTEERTYVDELCAITVEWHKTDKKRAKGDNE